MAPVALGRGEQCRAKFRYGILAAQTTAKDMPMLSELNPEKVWFIIDKLRELDVQADAPEDGFASVFTHSQRSSVRKELVDFIGSMNEDEQRELIALYLIGGVDFPDGEWPDDLAEAAAHPWTAAFLLGVPKAAGQLEEGLSIFGFSCEDVEEGRP
jgi:hypothetical protein